MQNIPVNLATASARKMKFCNSLFHMMLCSAATLHLAVDAKISPRPTAWCCRGQVARRPQFSVQAKAGSGASSRHHSRTAER
eukprot:5941568-Prymnesium_polylepis.1